MAKYLFVPSFVVNIRKTRPSAQQQFEPPRFAPTQRPRKMEHSPPSQITRLMRQISADNPLVPLYQKTSIWVDLLEYIPVVLLALLMMYKFFGPVIVHVGWELYFAFMLYVSPGGPVAFGLCTFFYFIQAPTLLLSFGDGKTFFYFIQAPTFLLSFGDGKTFGRFFLRLLGIVDAAPCKIYSILAGTPIAVLCAGRFPAAKWHYVSWLAMPLMSLIVHKVSKHASTPHCRTRRAACMSSMLRLFPTLCSAA